jgi:ubiquinone/menaquinone biosynthesis C-methylase UbiE
MRDSCDRFCDDLLEEILKYLSFNDKFKYECVSKQWQRCVFQRQYSVIVDNCKHHNSKDKYNNIVRIESLLRYYNNSDNKISKALKALQRVLNKCVFINHIYLRCLKEYEITVRDILSIIADNCLHLTSIKFNIENMSEDILLEFGQKCGHQLTTIHFGTISMLYYLFLKVNYQSFIKLCPNLLSIQYVNTSDLIETKNNTISLTPKLQELKQIIKDYEKFDANIVLFTEQKNSIRKLKSYIYIYR